MCTVIVVILINTCGRGRAGCWPHTHRRIGWVIVLAILWQTFISTSYIRIIQINILSNRHISDPHKIIDGESNCNIVPTRSGHPTKKPILCLQMQRVANKNEQAHMNRPYIKACICIYNYSGSILWPRSDHNCSNGSRVSNGGDRSRVSNSGFDSQSLVFSVSVHELM